MKKFLIVSAFLLAVNLQAATYYVDFATGSDANNGTAKATPWKYAPGMAGYTHVGYVHSAGDQFIFKGGVTWDNTIAPWNITNSGAVLTPDYYGKDVTWFTGGAWTNAILDGGSMNPIPAGLKFGYIYGTGHYITLDSLKVQNIGVAGTNQGNYGIYFYGDHDITVENCVFPENSRIDLIFQNGTGTTLSNIVVSGNDFSAASWGLGMGLTTASSVYNNVLVYGNSFHDFHTQLVNGQHGDGVIIYLSGAFDGSKYASNVLFYDNIFYGDFSKDDSSSAGMTAFVYCDGACNAPLSIFNNHGTDTASNGGYVFEISLANAGAVGLSNNSFNMDTAAGGWEGFLSLSNINGLTSEGNIYAGGQTVIYSGDATTTNSLVSDYNTFFGWHLGQFCNCTGKTSPGPSLYYGQFKAYGWEAHGWHQAPNFVSPTDLHLTSSSPGINSTPSFYASCNGQPDPGIGAQCLDASSNARQTSGNWDGGAYVYATPPGPAVDLSPSPFAFGTAAVGTSQVITLLNSGGSNLTITSIVAPTGFTESNDCGSTLASLASCSITVTVALKGTLSGILAVTTNASTSPDNVALTASAIGSGVSGSFTGEVQ
jgi:hypothetical protein